MRRLTRQQEQELREHEESMAAIARMRERPASGSNYAPRGSENVASPWVRPNAKHVSLLPPRQVAPVRPPLSKGTHGRVLPPARSSAPRHCCIVCFQPAPVDAKWRCASCASEIALAVRHAQSGLRVVS